MSKQLRVVHYINQFYGQIGSESAADVGISTREEAVGPGTLLNALLAERGQIVATIICGDNHIAENLDTVVPEVLEIIKSYTPDLFIAGPGFNAGRYGLACGALTAAVHKELKIASVTGLFVENPGTDLYKNDAYILHTSNHAKDLRKSMAQIVDFGLRLANEGAVGSAATEGYHSTGPVPEINHTVPAARRMVDMLLKKYHGQPFTTEVPIPIQEILPPSILKKPLSQAKIALVTDGGLVPKGNPDKMVPVNSVKFCHYNIAGKDKLTSAEYEVSHQGYDNTYVLEDPNRLVPVDAFRQLEKEGEIGKLWDEYYTTAGVMTTMENSKKFGQEIAAKLLDAEVDAVILTST